MADITPATLKGGTTEPNSALYDSIQADAETAINAKYTGKLKDHPIVNYLHVLVNVGRQAIADVSPQHNEQAFDYRRLAQTMDDALITAGWLSATTEVTFLKYSGNEIVLQYKIELIAQP